VHFTKFCKLGPRSQDTHHCALINQRREILGSHYPTMRTLLYCIGDLSWGLQRPLRDFEYLGCALGQSCKACVLG